MGFPISFLSFPICPKVFWQMLHWCGLRFSWTHSICVLIFLYSKAEYSNNSHLYFFLFSWTLCTSLLSCDLRPKLILQMLLWCGLRFSWTQSMWLLSLSCWRVEYSHKSHLYYFLFLWTISIFFLRFLWDLNEPTQ